MTEANPYFYAVRKIYANGTSTVVTVTDLIPPKVQYVQVRKMTKDAQQIVISWSRLDE